jgi:hypothetical protein
MSERGSLNMAGPIHEYLEKDHARLDALLHQSGARLGEIEGSSYAAFRAGLLRHIGLEEKILLPAARRARGGIPLPIAAQLRRDHAALAALLVPTPTREIIDTIREILTRHNPLEENCGGFYETCEDVLASDLDVVAAQLRAAPEVPVAPHFDGPRVREHIRSLLDDARRRPPGDA